jgi:hypothetical protein
MIKKVLISGCYACPHLFLPDDTIKFCLFAQDMKITRIDDIPEWCPLPDAEGEE